MRQVGPGRNGFANPKLKPPSWGRDQADQGTGAIQLPDEPAEEQTPGEKNLVTSSKGISVSVRCGATATLMRGPVAFCAA
jgi:hypothetical protein